MRIPAKPWIGWVVFGAYLVVFFATWTVNGIDYSRIGESADTLFRWYFMPLALGAVILIVAASVLGWWKPALFEKQASKQKWLFIAPAIMLALGIYKTSQRDISEVDVAMWVWVILGSLLVGFCEEMVARGILLTGLRGRYKETIVWLLTCIAFGLIHLPNAFFGAGAGAILQVFIAAGAGSLLYVFRRVSGSLIWPMLLHGFWDFSGFVGTTDAGLFDAAIPFIILVIGIIVGLIAIRETKGQKVPQYGDGSPDPHPDHVPEHRAAA